MTIGLSLILEVLERTPAVLFSLLGGLSDEWVGSDEGKGTYSPRQVVAHLVQGERIDWIPRVMNIMEGGGEPFEPVEDGGIDAESLDRATGQLLQDFQELRFENLRYVKGLNLTEEDLQREGTHPALGPVTLGQLLATWMTHDLDHLGQIARAMAHQTGKAVGPWKEYLRIVGE